jgi:hypothetical protein
MGGGLMGGVGLRRCGSRDAKPVKTVEFSGIKPVNGRS